MTECRNQNDALMSREYEMARELLKKGQKDKAMLLLRKKKYHQSLIEKTYAKLENIDEMVILFHRTTRFREFFICYVHQIYIQKLLTFIMSDLKIGELDSFRGNASRSIRRFEGRK